MAKLILTLSMLLVALFSTTNEGIASSLDRAALIAKFDYMDLSINKGEGYSYSTNELAYLTWAESYLLEAYLTMYEVTKNSKYLTSFVRHADRIVANTDVNRGVTDYKGRSLVGWSMTKYSNGERVVSMEGTGMITYPLVRFSLLVNKYNLDLYRSQAQVYKQTVQAALAVFDQNWVYDTVSGSGYYHYFLDEPSQNNTSPPMPLPFNQQLVGGRSFIVLYQLTGNRAYLAKAEALARHFKTHLKKNSSDGAYTWNYWYGKGYDRYNSVEDISHGAIDVDFAILAYRSGIVFNRVDILRLLQTYQKRIRKGSSFALKVDGSGVRTDKSPIGHWLELSEFSNVVWKDFYALVDSGSLPNTFSVMFGISKLIKYYK